MAVPVFRNTTARAGIEQWITEAVAREIASRGGLSIVSPDAADATLEGEVTSYSAWPATFDASGRASEYQIMITASARLVRRGGEEILRISDYRFQEPYLASSARGDAASDLENLAIEELSSRFAQGLVTVSSTDFEVPSLGPGPRDRSG